MTMITALRLQASLDDSLGIPWGTGDLRHKPQTCDCGHWCWCNVAKPEILFKLKIHEMDLLANKYVVQQCNTNPQNLKPILWFDTKRHFLGWNYLFWNVRLNGQTWKRQNSMLGGNQYSIHSFQAPRHPLAEISSRSSQGVSGTLEGWGI